MSSPPLSLRRWRALMLKVLLLIDSTCQGLLKLSLEDLRRKKKKNRHIKHHTYEQ